jgi:hypothetical protein
MGVYFNGVKQGGVYRNGVKMNAYRNGVKVFGGESSQEDFEGFGMVVNSGADSQFILPLRYGSGAAHHELAIDWGDGEVQVVTGGAGITAQYRGLTHSYPAANRDYDIKMVGSTYLGRAEDVSYFGFGFHYTSTGYNVASNKAKVVGLFGSPEYLISPAMSSKSYCYYGMFYGCSGLKELPVDLLPATAMVDECYKSMFWGCTGLKELPAGLLPATTLARSCYKNMFYGCNGMTEMTEG